MGNLIVKDNALVEASHRLSEVEQRLILLAILKAREFCDSVELLRGKELIIHADDYIRTFNVDRTTAYRVLKKSVVSLFRAEWGYKFINDKGLPQVAYRRFIQSADYVDNGATIHFKFADDIIPMLVELERRFTVYEIGQVSHLSSSYAMRLYEFFMQHLDKKTNKGWFKISLEDLRFRLGLLTNEYTLMSNFKKRVLDYAIKEINEHTDLQAAYTQHKQGRKIVGFTFEFTREKQPPETEQSNNTPKPPIAIDLFSGLNDEEREVVKAEIDDYISHLVKKNGAISDFHRQNITEKAVAERWGLAEYDEQKAQREAEEQERQRYQAELQAIQDNWQSDMAKLKLYAEEFVAANLRKITNAAMRYYIETGEHYQVVSMWEHHLKDPNTRKQFKKLDEILARD